MRGGTSIVRKTQNNKLGGARRKRLSVFFWERETISFWERMLKINDSEVVQVRYGLKTPSRGFRGQPNWDQWRLRSWLG